MVRVIPKTPATPEITPNVTPLDAFLSWILPFADASLIENGPLKLTDEEKGAIQKARSRALNYKSSHPENESFVTLNKRLAKMHALAVNAAAIEYTILAEKFSVEQWKEIFAFLHTNMQDRAIECLNTIVFMSHVEAPGVIRAFLVAFGEPVDHFNDREITKWVSDIELYCYAKYNGPSKTDAFFRIFSGIYASIYDRINFPTFVPGGNNPDAFHGKRSIDGFSPEHPWMSKTDAVYFLISGEYRGNLMAALSYYMPFYIRSVGGLAGISWCDDRSFFTHSIRRTFAEDPALMAAVLEHFPESTYVQRDDE